MSKNFKPVKKSFSEISEIWSKIKSLGYREKVKAYRVITFDIKTCYGKGLYTAEELNFFLKVLATTKMNAPVQNRILSEWLELTGYNEVKILRKKNGKVIVNTANIIVYDHENFQKISDAFYSKTNDIEMMNTGNVYIFTTRGDGLYNVQARIVDGPEPLLSAKELKCVIDAGQPYFLHLPSGHLVIGDFDTLGNPQRGIVQTVEPGYYKINVFHFYIPNKISSYYVVACKVENPEQNKFEDIDCLEGFDP